ncbi:MAG: dihydrodipicolinate reductase C-terminal domain-containing protein [Candidatus Krumholzibacteriia bacterium]
MIAVSVHGAEGRMGRLVAELVDEADDCHLAALVTEPGRELPAGARHPRLAVVGQDQLATHHPRGGVIVDFSLAGALDGLLVQARRVQAPLVTGVTGYSAAQLEALRDYARDHAVVQAPNFSVGIPALQLALRLLARTLPRGFDAEQVETHHRAKLDRPSGTARWLAAGWAAERGGDPPPTHSQRIGGVIGEHRWTLGDLEETLELTHRAHSRRAFLRGVLPAVRFAATAPAGLHGLTDVLQDLASGGA